MAKPLRDHDEKDLEVDTSVATLGFGFLHLPPTRYAPVVIKTVKKESWADQQGVLPGSELVELNGQEVGRMSADDFREALKQRPLQLRLAPPNGEVWKQVAAFQQQVVALSLQKVQLQQALKDESDRVMKELGICTELEKSNSMQHKAKLLQDQAQKLQEKQQLVDEVQKLKAELEAAQRAEQEMRRQMDVQEVEFRSKHAEMEQEKKDLEAKLAEHIQGEAQAIQDLERTRAELVEAGKLESEQELEALRSELREAHGDGMELTRCRADLATAEATISRQQLELKANEHVEEATIELEKLRHALSSAQPELDTLSQLAELFKVETPRRASESPRRSRRSVVPTPAVERAESEEEMF